MTEQKKEEEVKKVPSYRLLGSSGLRVFPLCLGAMTFGSKWSNFMGSTSDEDILKIMKKYYEIGGNFIDTANVYQNGESEEKLAWAINKLGINRDELVIATKYTNYEFGLRPPNNRGNQKKSMFHAVQGSLKRLNTNYIDILYVHFWDYTTSTQQIMKQLDDLVRSGKVLHVAISDAPAWEAATGNTLAELKGWSPFCCYQGRYSLVDRELENEVIPMSQKFGMGVVPWGIIGQGKLTGKRLKDKEVPTDVTRKHIKMDDLDYNIQGEVIKISEELKRSPSQIATNWLLQKPGIASGILGSRTYEQFEDSIKALDFKLTKEQMDKLDTVSDPAVKRIFPHNFISQSYKTNQWLTFGGDKYIIE